MDRSTFLSQTLPFLHLIPSSKDTVGIWKLHRDHILDYIISSQSTSSSATNKDGKIGRDNVNCLFSNQNYVVSIEPNIHCSTEMGKPAFFFSNDNHEDPALSGFGAYLLPVDIINSSPMPSSIIQGDDMIVSPMKYHNGYDTRKRHQASPAASSASTSMSTPVGGSNGGKFDTFTSINGKNKSIMNNDEDESCVKTYLLYFAFSRYYCNENNRYDDDDHVTADGKEYVKEVDIYFVDHQRIQSMEIIPNSLGQGIDETEHNDEIEGENNTYYKPTSLLIKFDTCNFRVMGKDFLFPPSDERQDGRSESDLFTYEQELRSGFDIMKNCITSHKEKLHLLKYDNYYLTDFSSSSFYSYISSIFVSPLHEEQESQSPLEYGQVEKALINDDDTTSKSNKTNCQDHMQETGETLESMKDADGSNNESTINSLQFSTREHIHTVRSNQRIKRDRKRKLQSYERSWNALEKAADLIKSQTNKWDTTHKKLSSLLRRSATELGNSFVVDDVVGIISEKSIFSSRNDYQQELETQISGMQQSVDQQIQVVFASSGRSTTMPTESENKISVEDIQRKLQNYRRTVAARHHVMFLPPR